MMSNLGMEYWRLKNYIVCTIDATIRHCDWFGSGVFLQYMGMAAILVI